MNHLHSLFPSCGTRRDLLRTVGQLAAGLASIAAAGAPPTAAGALADAPAPAASPPRVTFLTREDGVAALTRAAGDTYYANMGLLEIRARVRAPLAGLSLADARLAVRDFDAAAVMSFTDEECAAIRSVLDHLQPLLATRAPLYARTPWSFVKLADRAEGGMPHTRGPHIVIPQSAAEAYAKLHRELAAAGTLATSPRGRALLVHEQTHVLERAEPARFEPLYTDVFGFTRMTPAPTLPWLDSRMATNPDGPDLVWAFSLERIGGQGWVMPAVTLPDVARPRMPQDFQAIAVEVEKTAEGWKMVEKEGVPKARALDAIPGYHAHFPFADEDFHPTEIAAVALSHWILQDRPDLRERPLMPAIATWAGSALA